MKKLKSLSLKKEMITVLSADESKSVKGGIFSIGHNCSVRNACERLRTTHFGHNCPKTIQSPHYSHEGTCAAN